MYLFAMLAIAGGLTACSDDDDNKKDDITTFNAEFNVLSNHLSGDTYSSVYSQCTSKNAELNYTQKTLSITLTANLNGSYSHTMKLTDVKLTNATSGNTGWYEFKKDNFQDEDGNAISDFKGYIDFTESDNNMYFSYTVTAATTGSPKYYVECISGFTYGNANTEITVVDGTSESYSGMKYQLTPDATGKTCTLTIYNFVESLGLNTSVESGKTVTFKGLPLNTTAGNYNIVIDGDKEYKSTDGSYTMYGAHLYTYKNGLKLGCADMNINFIRYNFQDMLLFGSSKLNI